MLLSKFINEAKELLIEIGDVEMRAEDESGTHYEIASIKPDNEAGFAQVNLE